MPGLPSHRCPVAERLCLETDQNRRDRPVLSGSKNEVRSVALVKDAGEGAAPFKLLTVA